MNNKKEQEREWLDEVACILAEFPKGDIEECEEPDFLIKQKDRVVGIEVCRFIREQGPQGSTRRQRESVGAQILLQAKEEYGKIADVPLIVDITWSRTLTLNTRTMRPIVVALAQFISQHIPREINGSFGVDNNGLDDVVLSDCVIYINIWRMRQNASWNSHETTIEWPDVQPNQIQSLIATKDTKLAAYLKKSDETWLVIVSEILHSSSHLTNLETLDQHSFTSGMSRVYIYDEKNHKVIRLNTHVKHRTP